MFDLINTITKPNNKFISKDIEIFTTIENNDIKIKESSVSKNIFHLPPLATVNISTTISHELPSIDEFSKRFSHLRLSTNIINDKFYKDSKQVYLYDYNDDQVLSLRKMGLRVSYDENIGYNKISLPQTNVFPDNYIYSKTSFDAYDSANKAIKNMLQTADEIDPINIGINGVVTIISAYRGPLYQQHIRNTQGGRSKPKGLPGERNLDIYPPNSRIKGVGGVFTSEHNKDTALDLNHKTDYTDLKSIINTLRIFQYFKMQGFKGFGMYTTHIHVDKRKKFALWIQEGSQKGKINETLEAAGGSVKNISELKRYMTNILAAIN